MHGPIAHPVQMVALQSATPPLAALLQVQICPVSILSVRRSTSTGDKMYCSYALFLLSCSNDENVDIRPGDAGEDRMSGSDAMSIASMQSVVSNMPKVELEELVTTMFHSLMAKPKTRATPRTARTAAGGTAEPSPAKIAFENDHKKIVTATDPITQAIPTLTIEDSVSHVFV